MILYFWGLILCVLCCRINKQSFRKNDIYFAFARKRPNDNIEKNINSSCVTTSYRVREISRKIESSLVISYVEILKSVESTNHFYHYMLLISISDLHLRVLTLKNWLLQYLKAGFYLYYDTNRGCFQNLLSILKELNSVFFLSLCTSFLLIFQP